MKIGSKKHDIDTNSNWKAILLLLVFWNLNSFAKTVSKMDIAPGTPVDIVYTDGTQARVYKKDIATFFKVPLQLKENSCQAETTTTKCMMYIPYIRQVFSAIWTKHPSQQGQPLQYNFNTKVSVGTQVYVTKNQSSLYSNLIKSNPKQETFGIDPQLLKNSLFAEIVCEESVDKIFPKSREILFLDETYEGGNSELSIASGTGVRVNLNWRRYQDIRIQKTSENRMGLETYRKAYGLYVMQSPFGLAYSIQMQFKSQNFEDENDELCKVKWAVDFSQYFTQISALALGENKPMQIQEFTPFIYTYDNENPYSQKPIEKQTWENEGIQ